MFSCPGLPRCVCRFRLAARRIISAPSVLRKVGGWDPHNVTEDADLGIRLHRLGYRSAALPSATYEEAPARFVPWLKQRTRWYKGWMQTWRVHMRRPLQLMRELGLAGTIAFQLFLACNVLAALVHPIFMAVLGCYLFAQPPVGARPPSAQCAALHRFACRRLRLDHCAGFHRIAAAWTSRACLGACFNPAALVPAFACRLARGLSASDAPQRWEKTEHGLARNSRRDDLTRRRRGRRSIDWEPLTHPAATAIMATGADLLATPGGERGRPSRRRPQK